MFGQITDCPPTVCRQVWLSGPAFPSAMPASPALSAAAVVMGMVMRPRTLPQPLHHFMVFVTKHPRQKERGFVRASGFKASPWPPFAVDGNVPLSLGAGPALAAAAASRCSRVLRGVVAGGVGVVPQLVDSLHKLTLFVEHFLERRMDVRTKHVSLSGNRSGEIHSSLVAQTKFTVTYFSVAKHDNVTLKQGKGQRLLMCQALCCLPDCCSDLVL